MLKEVATMNILENFIILVLFNKFLNFPLMFYLTVQMLENMNKFSGSILDFS